MVWQHHRLRFPRPLYYTESVASYLGSKVVKVLTGQRRVGKSYILRQTAMHLVQQGVSSNNIVFINRELTAFDFIENYKDLDNFIRLYREELKPEGRIYIFIDEVQDTDGWERVVNGCRMSWTGRMFLSRAFRKPLSWWHRRESGWRHA